MKQAEIQEVLQDSNKLLLNFQRQLAMADKAMNRLGSSTRAVANDFRTFAVLSAGVNAAANFSRFESSLKKVVQASKDSSITLNRVKTDTLALSKETGRAATEIAAALLQAERGGYTYQNALRLTAGATTLAVDGMADLSTATGAVGKTLKTYNMDMNQQGRVMDVFAKANQQGEGSMEDLLTTIAAVAPTAKRMNLSIEQAAAAEALLTDQGAKAAGGTDSLRSLLNELGRSGSAADIRLRQLTGKSFRELQREGRNVGEVLTTLNEAVGADGGSLQELFADMDSGKAAMRLAANSGQEFNDVLNEMYYAMGAAQTAALIAAQTTDTQLTYSLNRVKTATLEAGQQFVPFGNNGKEQIQGVSNALGELVQQAEQESYMKVFADGAEKVDSKLSPLFTILSDLNDYTVDWGEVIIQTIGALGSLIGLIPGIPGFVGKGVAVGASVASGVYEVEKEAGQRSRNFGDEIEVRAANYSTAQSNTEITQRMANELTTLNLEISSGSIESVDELNTKLARQQEIIQWFKDNYGLYLTTQNGQKDFDAESIETIEEKNEVMTKTQRLLLENSLLEKKDDVGGLVEDVAAWDSKNNALSKQNETLLEQKNKLMLLKDEWEDFVKTNPSAMDRTAKLKEIAAVAHEITGFEFDERPMSAIDEVIQELTKDYAKNNAQIEQNAANMETANNSINQYQEGAKKIIEADLGKSYAEASEDLGVLNAAMEEYANSGTFSDETLKKVKNLIPDFDQAADKPAKLSEAVGALKDKLGAAEKKAHDLGTSVEGIKNREVTIEVNITEGSKGGFGEWFKSLFGGGGTDVNSNAAGTAWAEAGLSVVNEEGPELIQGRDGSFRMAKGSPALTYLQAGDRVYTADETKAMTGDIRLPGFARGKKDPTAYEIDMDNFQHRTKTSEVSDEEKLQFYQSQMEKYGGDAEIARDLEESIYALKKSIDERNKKEAEEQRKERVSQYVEGIKTAGERDSRWNNRELKFGHIDQNDALYAIGERAKFYRAQSDAIWQNADMTDEEKSKYAEEFMRQAEDLELEYFTQNREMQRKLGEALDTSSLDYIKTRNYFNDWGDFGDDPLKAYERIRERKQQQLREAEIDEKEYADSMKKIADELYNGRVAASKKWLEEQRYYGKISHEEYIAGLQRMKGDTEEYYAAGLLNNQEYAEAVAEIDKSIYTERVNACKEAISQLEQEKKQVAETANERISAMEKAYNKEKELRSREERDADIADLRRQEQLYMNAQTKEGKEKLRQIREQLSRLVQQNYDEDRQAELEAEKERLQAENDRKTEEIDAKIKAIPAIYGLAVDEQGNYSMAANYQQALEEQSVYSGQSLSELKGLNQDIGKEMSTSSKRITSGLLDVFGTFRSNLADIVAEVSDSLRVLDSTVAYGGAASVDNRSSTNITYNDYGTKNIRAEGDSYDLFPDIRRLLAMGIKL